MAKNNTTPDFQKMAAEMLKELPMDVANMARDFFRGNFDKEGFADYAFIAWPKRKDSETHKILTKSGALKESVTIVQATMSVIEIEAGKNQPYAGIQNTGGVINIRVTDKARKFFWYMFSKTNDTKWKYMALTKKDTLTITIPQRQYIGESGQLMKDVDKHVIETIIKRFKQMK